MIKETALLNKFLSTAARSGMPEDQTRLFVNRGYIPQEKQIEFHAAARQCDLPGGPTTILMGGARGPGKSHAAMAQVGLDDCQAHPGLKWLFLRKKAKAARESFEDLIKSVYSQIPYEFIPSQHRLLFPNGSQIFFGGFLNDKDIDGYLGIAYDGIVVEEATMLTEAKTDQLEGSCRTTREDWRARKYYTTNPGSIGHQYYKKRFVIPHIQGKEADTPDRFIPSTYQDNAYLAQEYIDYLLRLKGPLGKAWRDGSWDVFEGQAFPTWDEELHVIDPFEIDDDWPRWRSIDWGYSAPFCCLWLTRQPVTHRIFVYRELYRTMLTVKQQCDLIKEFSPPSEHILFTYADPALWSRKDQDNMVTTTAQEYAKYGVNLVKADNARLAGKRKVDDILGLLPDGDPGLQAFSTCVKLIETLPALIFDDVQVEDVDTTGDDHAYDSLRYGLSNMLLGQEPASRPTKTEHPVRRLMHGRNRH